MATGAEKRFQDRRKPYQGENENRNCFINCLLLSFCRVDRMDTDLKQAELMGNKIKFSFPRTFIDARRAKLLSGRGYIEKFDFWTCDLLIQNVIALKQWGFTFETKLNHWHSQNKPELNELSNNLKIPWYRIEETGEKRCNNCIYNIAYACGICSELRIPAEIWNYGCINFRYFNGYF